VKTSNLRLRVFENKVLRRIFGQKGHELMGEWRKLHNDELHGFYSSPCIIDNYVVGGAYSKIAEDEHV
jgi:hypothetical protein